MPCQGPSREEVRTANDQRDLYQLMLDIHHYGKDNGAALAVEQGILCHVRKGRLRCRASLQYPSHFR